MNRIHMFAVAIVCIGSAALWSSHDHDSRERYEIHESLPKKPISDHVSKLGLANTQIALAKPEQKPHP